MRTCKREREKLTTSDIRVRNTPQDAACAVAVYSQRTVSCAAAGLGMSALWTR